jgi:Rieske Fe-S protein
MDARPDLSQRHGLPRRSFLDLVVGAGFVSSALAMLYPIVRYLIPPRMAEPATTTTHLECTVQYKTDTSQIWCACHNGLFDLAGNVVSGPPPRALTALAVNLRGEPGQEEIVVSRRT